MKHLIASAALVFAAQANAGPIFDTGSNLQHYSYQASSTAQFTRYTEDRLFRFNFRQDFDRITGRPAYRVTGTNYQYSTRTTAYEVHEDYGWLRKGQAYSFDGAGTLTDWTLRIVDIVGSFTDPTMDVKWSLQYVHDGALYVTTTKSTQLYGGTVRQWVSAPSTVGLIGLALGLSGIMRSRYET